MDQKRQQSGDQAQDRAQAQTRERTSTGPGEGIYGGNLMTAQERSQYREQLGGLKTDQERAQFKARHQQQMQLRAKERGIEPEITSD